MNNVAKLALKPDFTFRATDFVPAQDDGAGPQGILDLGAAAASIAPWDQASPGVTGYTFRMATSLHAKLAWVAENVPKHRSIQVTLEKAVTGYVDALIEKHYSPGD
jgi:hypothetical protein